MSDLLALSAAVRQSRANLLSSQLAGGSVKLYTAARPADADTAITDQVLLAEFTLTTGTAEDGVWTGVNPDPVMILATGTPVWGRFADSAGDPIADADVGLTGSGNAIEVENDNFISGAYASITSLVIAEG